VSFLSPEQREELKGALQPILEAAQKQARAAMEPQLAALDARVRELLPQLKAQLAEKLLSSRRPAPPSLRQHPIFRPAFPSPPRRRIPPRPRTQRGPK
jgi:hypothetical protein